MVFLERLLADLNRAHGLRSISLRYFNAAGADPEGEIGEAHDPETHLVPLVLAAARDGKQPLVRPRQARRALETALMIDEASERSGAQRSRQELVAYAAAN